MSSPIHLQHVVSASSQADPAAFWSRQAAQLSWHRTPTTPFRQSTRTLSNGVSHPSWSWFPDGEISTTYNCLDRHIAAGHGASTALIWDSPVDAGRTQHFSYTQLRDEVATLAAVLREQGVRKGDTVVIYMPMIPAAVIGMLAVARLGAIHAVVFGGFSAAALAQRIEDSGARLVLTASCGIEGAKGPVPYREMVRGARQKTRGVVERVLVWQREVCRWGALCESDGERDWAGLVRRARERGLAADNVPVSSTDGLYIIYTSGTTGSPKGVLREAGGHAVGLNFTVRYIFGVRGPGDVMFTASDIGWVVGHSYIVYAPLLAGATTVLFEGKPVGTPDAGTFWRVVAQHRVTSLFTAPTALRAIRKEDPRSNLLIRRGERGELRCLRALFLAGERSEPAIVSQYQHLLARYGAPNATVIDNWWSSESGSPMTALTLLPGVGQDVNDHTFYSPLPTKPGSAGKPMPGFDVRVVDDDGKPLRRGAMGNIVLAPPFGPTGMTTLWRDDERFYRGYLKRFQGRWIDTGDAGTMDADGYVHVMSRSDDIINVAAHRLSTGALEQAIGSHPRVAEAAVVPLADPTKGHVPFAFIALVPPSTVSPPRDLLAQLNARLRDHIGPFARLAGFIARPGIIPKTRSGKTLRRCLKDLLQNATAGDFAGTVPVPATVEDLGIVEAAREAVEDYFTRGEGRKLRARL